jgi:hypothetical protein
MGRSKQPMIPPARPRCRQRYGLACPGRNVYRRVDKRPAGLPGALFAKLAGGLENMEVQIGSLTDGNSERSREAAGRD